MLRYDAYSWGFGFDWGFGLKTHKVASCIWLRRGFRGKSEFKLNPKCPWRTNVLSIKNSHTRLDNFNDKTLNILTKSKFGLNSAMLLTLGNANGHYKH